LISVNVDNALGEKLKTGDRRLYAKEAAEILLASPV
jgi:hypothetical protein